MDGFPSGQRGQTVNLLAPPSKVRILLHPLRNEQVNQLETTKAVRILLHPLWNEQMNRLETTKAIRILLHPLIHYAAVAELADAQDLKSCGTYTPVPVRFRFAAVNYSREC